VQAPAIAPLEQTIAVAEQVSVIAALEQTIEAAEPE